MRDGGGPQRFAAESAPAAALALLDARVRWRVARSHGCIGVSGRRCCRCACNCRSPAGVALWSASAFGRGAAPLLRIAAPSPERLLLSPHMVAAARRGCVAHRCAACAAAGVALQPCNLACGADGAARDPSHGAGGAAADGRHRAACERCLQPRFPLHAQLELCCCCAFLALARFGLRVRSRHRTALHQHGLPRRAWAARGAGSPSHRFGAESSGGVREAHSRW